MTPSAVDSLASSFRDNGVVVVPGVLSPAEVEACRAAFADDQVACADKWKLGHTRSCGVGPEILFRTETFDRIASLRQSPLRPLIERLFEPHVPHLCGLSCFVREANLTEAGSDPSDPDCITRVWVRFQCVPAFPWPSVAPCSALVLVLLGQAS